MLIALCGRAGAAIFSWRIVRRLGLPCMLGAAAAVAAAVAADVAMAAPQPVRVLHWWKSTSERLASNTIAAGVRQAGIDWIDEDTGDGVGAAIVLRSRILAHDMPDIVQAASMASYNWASLNLVADLDRVAAADHWEQRLLPVVYRIVRPAGHVIAAPLGIHRMNTLFYNRQVFARLRLAPPRTWDEFERIAPRLLRAGVVPLAQSSQPWQVSVLFENLVVADGGVAQHRRLYVDVDEDGRAFSDPAVGAVLRHMRSLKRWMRRPVPETNWTEIARELALGSAAMMVAGDWVKGELAAAGAHIDREIGCLAAPGTEAVHVFDMDTLVMLRSDRVPRAAQEKIARTVVSVPLQERYNRLKGSVPVLRDADPATMDSCARASWAMVSDPGATVLSSIAVGMSGDEVMRDALAAELHRFFMDDSVTVQDTQRRLAAISRAFARSSTQ